MENFTHRRYLIQRLCIKQYWRLLQQAWRQWRDLMHLFRALASRLAKIYWQQQQLKALNRWKIAMRLERMEEELIATHWSRQYHHQTTRLQAITIRRKNKLLVSYWIQWKTWHRKAKSQLLYRRTRVLLQSTFRRWRQSLSSVKQEPHEAASLVHSMQSAMHATLLPSQGRYMRQMQLAHAFGKWKTVAKQRTDGTKSSLPHRIQAMARSQSTNKHQKQKTNNMQRYRAPWK